MSREPKSIVHDTGPFADVVPGDTLRVIYHGAPASLFVVTRVKRHAIEGKDGEFGVRVTRLDASDELRFYGEIAPNRTTVLRDVRIVKGGASIMGKSPKKGESKCSE